ncbi:MAG: hypothetical protein SGJ10_04710 [Bacteroidota bacterium]|nr:hypothetical protein [Bacteroidota bacterium]
MKRQKVWMFTGIPKSKEKLSESEKIKIQNQCQPLLEVLKKKYIQNDINKEYSQLVDIYTRWYRNYFYFCEKIKSEHPDRIMDEFEKNFVRLEYCGKDQFKFSYFWHNISKFQFMGTMQHALRVLFRNFSRCEKKYSPQRSSSKK